MNSIKIVVDSSSNLTALNGVDFACAPLKIITESKEYTDTAALDVNNMVDTLYSYKGKSSTSCPNLTDWLNAFGDAESIVCFTITSNLSGSYNSAYKAKEAYEAEHPERTVLVIDTLSAGPEIALMAEKCRELILLGKSLDEIEKELPLYKTELLFVLESMKNLANNGRISKLAAAAAGVLGVRAIGKASDEGTLEMLSKCRGASKAVQALAEHAKELGYKGGKIRIAHCQNEPLAKDFAAKISAEFSGAQILIEECRALCSFYAEKGGMLIGFEV